MSLASEVVPVVVIGGLAVLAFKVGGDVLAHVHGHVAAVSSGNRPAPPSSSANMTCNGILWARQADGSYIGQPVCPPGQPCSHLLLDRPASAGAPC